jgi:hypothetical protein
MSNAGVKPVAILSALRMADGETFANLRTIYNARFSMRTEELAGRSPVDALLDNLQENSWIYHVEANESGNITGLFFAHPESVTLANQYNHVVVMDCTYKTNRFRMPLLHIIGMTSFNTTFTVGFCFLAMERFENYMWAMSKLSKVWKNGCVPNVIVTDRELALMNAIQQVFPLSTNILCIWHINKNILAYCKKHYEVQETFDAFMQVWNVLVSSTSEEDYEKQVLKLTRLLSDKPEVLNYVTKTWLIHKKHFVKAWTLNYPHFGSKTSSRAEGAHAFIKKFLQVSTGDLLTVFNKLKIALDHQIKAEMDRRSKETMHHLLTLPEIFTPVSGKISLFALKECLLQHDKICQDSSLCTGIFTLEMGIPCSHQLEAINKSGGSLTANNFHAQWQLEQNSKSVRSMFFFRFGTSLILISLDFIRLRRKSLMNTGS